MGGGAYRLDVGTARVDAAPSGEDANDRRDRVVEEPTETWVAPPTHAEGGATAAQPRRRRRRHPLLVDGRQSVLGALTHAPHELIQLSLVRGSTMRSETGWRRRRRQLLGRGRRCLLLAAGVLERLLAQGLVVVDGLDFDDAADAAMPGGAAAVERVLVTGRRDLADAGVAEGADAAERLEARHRRLAEACRSGDVARGGGEGGRRGRRSTHGREKKKEESGGRRSGGRD